MAEQITTDLVAMDRTDRDNFSTQCDDFWEDLPAWVIEANELSKEVNSNTVVSAANIDELLSISNFQGPWTAQAYSVFQSVSYLGKMWECNAVTVAGDIPGTSTKWSLLTRDTGFKNFVINGNFVAWDRGTSGFVAAGYTANQWRLNNISAGACICERVTKSDGRYGIRFAKNTCTTAYQNLEQRIELPQRFAGTVLNLSFKVKFLVASADFFAQLKWVDGSSTALSMAQLNLSDTTNEQTYTISFTMPSDATDYSYLKLQFFGNLATGTVDYDFELSNIQLEAGAIDTEFEARPLALERALCQRYYYRISAAAAEVALGMGMHLSATTSRITTHFPVPMRTTPVALLQSGTAGDYSVMQAATPVVASIVPSFSFATTENASTLVTVAGGLTAGDGTYLRATGATWLAWSAEL